MRISDWSSDVCSSDLVRLLFPAHAGMNRNAIQSRRYRSSVPRTRGDEPVHRMAPEARACRSEEHTSELQSLMRISYAVFCLKKKKKQKKQYKQDTLQTNTSKLINAKTHHAKHTQ